MSSFLPSVLTIAGSDSGGGAGIQADLRTFNYFKVYGCSVITAVTAQNPDAVLGVDVLSVPSVKKQLDAVLELFPVRFVKTGMLANAGIIECVSQNVKKHGLQLILDPVMVSTSGAKLLEDSAVSALKELLFPLAQWITPNVPEAELICGCEIKTRDDLIFAAEYIYRQYKCSCLLKSGHIISASGKAEDIACYRGKLFSLSTPAVKISGNTSHGTGCTLSAAITAALAQGKNWQDALVSAKAFVCGSLCQSRFLSDTLSQMYPPEENFSIQVEFKEL